MMQQVEISSFDLRYESYRVKDKRPEKALFSSILEHGIQEPLQGVDTAGTSGTRILLNGFKRYRCAVKLSIKIVPYTSLGNDEAFGIITLLRIANSKKLTILEQAKLIDELKNVHKMSVAEIAQLLEKSNGWVSMRLGMIKQMSESVMEKIFNGQFPAYSYIYSLRPFIRMNGIKNKEIDEFVNCVAGKNLSIRDIHLLIHGYFKGSDDFRQQIKSGDISWGLSRLKDTNPNINACTELEKRMLKDLEITKRYMKKVTYKSIDSRLKSNSFYAQANLLVEGILKQLKPFSRALEEFYDRP
jgi:hypothetical protein